MGPTKEDNLNDCGHIWRRLMRKELLDYETYQSYIICSLCGFKRQVPFDMLLRYDFYFPSFPEDQEDDG